MFLSFPSKQENKPPIVLTLTKDMDTVLSEKMASEHVLANGDKFSVLLRFGPHEEVDWHNGLLKFANDSQKLSETLTAEAQAAKSQASKVSEEIKDQISEPLAKLM